MTRKYEVSTANNANTFQFNSDELNTLDIAQLSDGSIHLILNGESYTCKIIQELDYDKRLIVEVNGKEIPLQIKDDLDLLIKSMGMRVGEKKISNNIAAPMPGLILQIKVEPGQSVEPGTEILILEAMKMENTLKSQGQGIVKEIKITPGQSVEKGQLLIVIE
jgi:biotin carboxyl carrier protein